MSLSILGSPPPFVLLSTSILTENSRKSSLTRNHQSSGTLLQPQVRRGWRRQHRWHGVICDVRDSPDVLPMLCGNWYSQQSGQQQIEDKAGVRTLD